MFKFEMSVTEWAVERVREAFERVASEEAESLSIVQRILLKGTDFLLRIIAPAGHSVIFVPTLQLLSS